jgi:sugar phosphate isomerase/epimerase
MKIGWDHYSIAHRNLDPFQALDLLKAHGGEGMQFLEPEALDLSLDQGVLKSIRDTSDSLGLYLEVGLPCPNPCRRSRLIGRELSIHEMVDYLRPQVEAIAVMNLPHARLYMGDRHDRFRDDPDWRTQISAGAEVLRGLTPVLKDHGIRIAIETHADFTVEEMLQLFDSLDDQQFGVTLDTGNLAMRLQDPIRSVERLAGRVMVTHLKDAVLDFSPRGLRWQARPIGKGVVPIAEIVQLLYKTDPHLNLSIELHPRIYDLPIFDPSWLRYFPDLKPEGLASIIALAYRGSEAIRTGEMESLETQEAVPWSDRDLASLDSSMVYLRKVVGDLKAW